MPIYGVIEDTSEVPTVELRAQEGVVEWIPLPMMRIIRSQVNSRFKPIKKPVSDLRVRDLILHQQEEGKESVEGMLVQAFPFINRPIYKHLEREVMRLMDAYQHDRDLIITGSSGMGKSHGLCRLYYSLREKGKLVLYLPSTVFDFLTVVSSLIDVLNQALMIIEVTDRTETQQAHYLRCTKFFLEDSYIAFKENVVDDSNEAQLREKMFMRLETTVDVSIVSQEDVIPELRETGLFNKVIDHLICLLKDEQSGESIALKLIETVMKVIERVGMAYVMIIDELFDERSDIRDMNVFKKRFRQAFRIFGMSYNAKHRDSLTESSSIKILGKNASDTFAFADPFRREDFKAFLESSFEDDPTFVQAFLDLFEQQNEPECVEEEKTNHIIVRSMIGQDKNLATRHRRDEGDEEKEEMELEQKQSDVVFSLNPSSSTGMHARLSKNGLFCDSVTSFFEMFRLSTGFVPLTCYQVLKTLQEIHSESENNESLYQSWMVELQNNLLGQIDDAETHFKGQWHSFLDTFPESKARNFAESYAETIIALLGGNQDSRSSSFSCNLLDFNFLNFTIEEKSGRKNAIIKDFLTPAYRMGGFKFVEFYLQDKNEALLLDMFIRSEGSFRGMCYEKLFIRRVLGGYNKIRDMLRNVVKSGDYDIYYFNRDCRDLASIQEYRSDTNSCFFVPMDKDNEVFDLVYRKREGLLKRRNVYYLIQVTIQKPVIHASKESDLGRLLLTKNEQPTNHDLEAKRQKVKEDMRTFCSDADLIRFLWVTPHKLDEHDITVPTFSGETLDEEFGQEHGQFNPVEKKAKTKSSIGRK